MDAERYDAIAVNLADSRVLWVHESTTIDNAEAAVSMAVMRQGCEDRFFTTAPHGKYTKGDRFAEVGDDE